MSFKLTSALIFFLLSSSSLWAKYELGAGLSSGKFEGESISTQFIEFFYRPDYSYKFAKGFLSFAYGARANSITSESIQANEKSSESIEDVDILALNFFAQSSYTIEKFEFGFNLDVIGISSFSKFRIRGTTQKVANETTNLFLYGENDRGTLNSHLFASYLLGKLRLKAFLSHAVIEFEDSGLPKDQSRQRFFDTFGLGISYLFN